MGSWIAGLAAGLAAATLLVGVAATVKGTRAWTPWLALLAAVNASRRGTTRDALRGVRPVDVTLLILAATSYVGFWPGPGAAHDVWMTIAIAQPALGIPLLVATRMLGRSGLMGGGFVLSVLMVVDERWTAAGWCGLVACLLLLVGDFGTTGRRSRLLAVALCVGYVALVVWFAWLAVILLG